MILKQFISSFAENAEMIRSIISFITQQINEIENRPRSSGSTQMEQFLTILQLKIVNFIHGVQ